jgi:hypothetical protein
LFGLRSISPAAVQHRTGGIGAAQHSFRHAPKHRISANFGFAGSNAIDKKSILQKSEVRTAQKAPDRQYPKTYQGLRPLTTHANGSLRPVKEYPPDQVHPAGLLSCQAVSRRSACVSHALFSRGIAPSSMVTVTTGMGYCGAARCNDGP